MLNEMVLVEWIDAESEDAWTNVEDVDHSITPIMSVGWLVYKDEESLSVALNHDVKNDSVSCMMKIPMGMIVSIKKLKE